MKRALLLASLLAACAPDGAEDAVDDTFALADDKSDGALVDGSPVAIGVLRVANGGSFDTLRRGVGLTSRAASNVIAARTKRAFYTLAALDAVPYIGPASLERLVAYAEAHPEVFGPTLTRVSPGLSPDDANLVDILAGDTSLTVDGDGATLTASEWERGLFFAHHFGPDTSPRIAALRGFFAPNHGPAGPFVDLATLPRTWYGEGELSWAIDALLVRLAADPAHHPGRISAAELAAAGNGAWWASRDFVEVWGANVPVSDPGDLPPDRARARDLLRSFGAEVFSGPYPAERPVPVEMPPLGFPFLPGTDVLCMQGNNTMASPASHAPHTLRYAVDLHALPGTVLTAAADGVAYVYGGGRVGKMDNWAFGNLLLIDLGNGYALMYAHASSFLVATGDRVSAGQPVAIIGNTGPASPEQHLHFQLVRLYRQPDPATEQHQADSFSGPFPEAPFGTAERFVMTAIDVTAADPAPRALDSTQFVCGEAGYLLGAGHIYRAP